MPGKGMSMRQASSVVLTWNEPEGLAAVRVGKSFQNRLNS
jgi:hypothetical protein